MSQTIHVLRTLVQSNLGTFQRDMDTVITKARTVAAQWRETASAVATAIDRTTTAITGLATVAVGAGARMGFAFNSLKERSLIAFESILGDATKAQNLFADLSAFAKKTPFELPGLLNMSIGLLNAKVGVEKLIPTMTALGDAIARQGGSSEQIDRASLAITQMLMKGRVSLQELGQLAEAKIPAFESMAEAMGTDLPTAMKLIETGAVQTADVFDRFIASIGRRFKDGMKDNANTWEGLFSTLTDTLSESSGKVFEPLFEEAKRGVKELTTVFDDRGLVEQLRSKVADLVQWWRENRTEIIENVQAFIAFLQPIAQFLVEHPRLLAALVALKITGFLGLNAIVVALIGNLLKLPTTISNVRETLQKLKGGADGGKQLSTMGEAATQLGGKLKGMATAANLAKAGLVGLAVTGIAALAYGIYQLNPDIRAFNAELEKTRKLSAQIQQKQDTRRQGVLAQAEGMSPEDKQAFLRDQLELARKDEAGLQSQLKGSQGRHDELNTTVRWATGNKLLAVAEEEVQETEARLAAQREWRVQLEGMVQESKSPNAPGLSPVDPKSLLAAGGGTGSGQEKSVEDLLKAAQDQAANRELAGLTELRDFLSQQGVTAEQVAAYTSTIEGATAEDAAIMAERFAARESSGETVQQLAAELLSAIQSREEFADRAEQTQPDVSNFAMDMGEQVRANELTTQQAQRFTAQMQQLAQAFTNGSLSQQQYEMGTRMLDNAVRSAAEANREQQRAAEESSNAIRESQQASTSFRQRIVEAFGPSGLQAAQPVISSYGQQLAALQDRLRNGQLSVDGFKNAVAQLNTQTEKAAELQRRQALLRGDFAGGGLDFRSAVEDRLIQFRQQQFSGYVDSFVQQMYGLGQAVAPVAQQFGQLQGQMQQFGSALNSSSSSGGVGQAVAAFGSIVSTIQGQIALVTNNINQLYFNMQSLDTYRDRAAIQEQINAAESLLNSLIAEANTSYAPTPSPVDPYGDPALFGNQSLTQNLSFPNITRITNSEVSEVATAILDELSRRGQFILG